MNNSIFTVRAARGTNLSMRRGQLEEGEEKRNYHCHLPGRFMLFNPHDSPVRQPTTGCVLLSGGRKPAAGRHSVLGSIPRELET